MTADQRRFRISVNAKILAHAHIDSRADNGGQTPRTFPGFTVFVHDRRAEYYKPRVGTNTTFPVSSPRGRLAPSVQRDCGGGCGTLSRALLEVLHVPSGGE